MMRADQFDGFKGRRHHSFCSLNPLFGTIICLTNKRKDIAVSTDLTLSILI